MSIAAILPTPTPHDLAQLSAAELEIARGAASYKFRNATSEQAAERAALRAQIEEAQAKLAELDAVLDHHMNEVGLIWQESRNRSGKEI